MKMLEDRIRADGIVREGNVLKVDSFINHQMDIPLFREMAREWKRLFEGKPINKVLTIEASGIGIAAIVASEFNVPVVFAKKSMSINLDYNNYETKIQSFTHKKIYNVIVSKKFLTAEDHVLIIDDFLANGCALMGLLDLALGRISLFFLVKAWMILICQISIQFPFMFLVYRYFLRKSLRKAMHQSFHTLFVVVSVSP